MRKLRLHIIPKPEIWLPESILLNGNESSLLEQIVDLDFCEMGQERIDVLVALSQIEQKLLRSLEKRYREEINVLSLRNHCLNAEIDRLREISDRKEVNTNGQL